MTSVPRSFLTSSIHLGMLLKDCLPTQQKYTRHIIDNHSYRRVSDVGRNKGAEPFLSCGIPELEPDSPVLVVERL